MASASVLAVSACAERSDTPCAAAWSLAAPALDRVALSVTADAQGRVLAVGGGLGTAGLRSLLLRFDAPQRPEPPRELDMDRPETLWWVFQPAPTPPPTSGASGDDTRAIAVGERGLVLRVDTDGAIETIPSPTTATLYGVWGVAADDLWIVGGSPGAQPGDDDVVLRFDGTNLVRDEDVPRAGVALFKIWGASADDIWVVGESGRLLRRRAGAWEDWSAAAATPSPLLTVSGCGPDDVFAVGGSRILRFDGAAWSRVTAVSAPGGANGVACGAASVLVVGNGGTKLRLDRATGDWTDETDAATAQDLHAAFVGPAGDLWAAGGNFLAPANQATRQGVVAVRRCD